MRTPPGTRPINPRRPSSLAAPRHRRSLWSPPRAISTPTTLRLRSSRPGRHRPRQVWVFAAQPGCTTSASPADASAPGSSSAALDCLLRPCGRRMGTNHRRVETWGPTIRGTDPPFLTLSQRGTHGSS
ncbi:hypothetical protein BS78_06G060700 [Paspalum vaginatum]|nr:hypothetical protein BS78_06G060700 [Paspalum vaginatum]